MKRSKMGTPLRHAHFDNCGLFFQKLRVFQTLRSGIPYVCLFQTAVCSGSMPFPDTVVCSLKIMPLPDSGMFFQKYLFQPLFPDWFVLLEYAFYPCLFQTVVCSSRSAFSRLRSSVPKSKVVHMHYWNELKPVSSSTDRSYAGRLLTPL